MIKTFDIALEEQRPVDPQNSFAIYRGDNVQFNFSFLKNGIELEIPTGTILRVFAKKIEKNGIVDVNENPVFAGEWTDSTSATFNSSLTAGDAGMYLMSVMLVSSDESVITSQAIYFEIKENGYAGRYQPSADYRDEVLNAKQDSIKARNEAKEFRDQASEYAYTAETSASEASTSESNAFNFAESSRMYSESAITAGSNALQYSQQAEDFKEQAKDFRDETLVARDEAVLAKDTAVEISDPEGWRTNTRSMINDLQQTKINRGEIFLQNGKIEASQTIEMNGAFSVVWTATRDVDVYGGVGGDYRNPYIYTGLDKGTQKGFALTMDDQWVGFYFRWWKSNGSSGRISNTLNVQGYFDGKPHVWAYVFNGTSVKLIVDDSIVANAPVDDFAPTTPTNPLTITSPNSTISRIKYFNFDMSSDEAPYTIADYVAGKDESPLLNSTLLSLDDYSFNGKIADVSGNNNDATITGDVVGTKDKSVEKMYQAFASRIGNITE